MKPALIEFVKWIADITLIAIGIVIILSIVFAVFYYSMKLIYGF